MAKVIVTNVTERRIGVPAPVNRVLLPFQTIEIEQVSADKLELAEGIGELIDAGLITFDRVNEDPTISDELEAGQWAPAVSTVSALNAITGEPGEARIVLNGGSGSPVQYIWNSFANTWELLSVPLVVIYAPSATDPTIPTPTDGDLYYNTVLNMWMFYDGDRGKFLSIEVGELRYGRSGATATGSFFRGADNITFTSSLGLFTLHNGTVVAMNFTRSNTASGTIEVTADGSVLTGATLATGAASSGDDTTLNVDFLAGAVLGVRNQSGGSDMNDTQGTIVFRWRV